MDYVVGSVAALISGNVTPNRPKLIRRALTPTKHQPSPNVTPKSEFVEDRSIFLSPTQQKKKAIVKKSPKRIFQNPDLDVTEDCEGNSSLTSPKAQKVKKHLKDELEADNMGKKKSKSPNCMLDKSSDDVSPTKKGKIVSDSSVTNGTPKKKKNKNNSESNDFKNDNAALDLAYTSKPTESPTKSPKKKQPKSISEKSDKLQKPSVAQSQENSSNNESNSKKSGKNKNKKQKKKDKKAQPDVESTIEDKENNQLSKETEQNQGKKKKMNRKNKAKYEGTIQSSIKQQEDEMEVENEAEDDSDSDSEELNSRNIPNPNAITEKDSDSEHNSDDELESENEEANEKVLTNENAPESSDEEEDETKSTNNKNKQKETKKEEKGQHVMSEDEIKRTLFVGNVPFSKKCKKEIKKIFGKYGQIETIRIRTIPVKDARVTPKLAIIKNELHPERSTVNVYIKYADSASLGQAIAENNTILNGNHLRVSRSDCTGSEHDPRCAVFVGNLPFAIEDDVLRGKFDKCGEITSVRIIRDKKTNAGKGFGYINFVSKDGVELALALSEEDLTIKNRILRVKRCTQTHGKPGKPDQGQQGYQRGRGGYQGGRGGYQGGRGGYQGGRGGYQGGRGGHQGGRGGYQGGRGGHQGGRGGYQGGRGGHQGERLGNQGEREGNPGSRQGYQGGKPGQGVRQANRGGWQGSNGGRPGNQGESFGQGGGGKWGQQGGKGDQGPDGAARRLMNKRKFQDSSSGDGPPNKLQNVTQPAKEKKQRKEFVGMTADKKKKHKFDKGLKKKKALSEILTK